MDFLNAFLALITCVTNRIHIHPNTWVVFWLNFILQCIIQMLSPEIGIYVTYLLCMCIFHNILTWNSNISNAQYIVGKRINE